MSKLNVSREKGIALQKLIVGHFIESIPEGCNKSICYVLQGDGLWERRSNKIGTFISQVQKFNVPGLNSNFKETWELNVPKIPAGNLVQIISFFRKIHRTYSSEVFVQVFYDFETGEYFSHVPTQVVSGTSVHYTNEFAGDANKSLVFEIHSHNTMGAFFSGTDDADEKSDRFYGVVGKLNNYYPEMKVRMSIGGRFQEVGIDELFEIDANDTYFAEVFPAEWMSKVTEQKFKIRRHRGSKKVYMPMGSPYSGGGQQLVLVNGEEDDISNYRSSFYNENRYSKLYSDKDLTNRDDEWQSNLLLDDNDEDDGMGVPDWRRKRF